MKHDNDFRLILFNVLAVNAHSTLLQTNFRAHNSAFSRPTLNSAFHPFAVVKLRIDLSVNYSQLYLKCLTTTGFGFSQIHISNASILFTCKSRMLRASLSSSGRLSVCLSVCLSVTLVICIKMVQARITKSLLWAAPRSLVYRDKILCYWVQGFPSNEGVEEGYPPKKTSFCRYWLK